MNANVYDLVKFLLKYVPENPVHTKPSVVQTMPWLPVSTKPLPELLMCQFTDRYRFPRPQHLAIYFSVHTDIYINRHYMRLFTGRATLLDWTGH